MGTYGTKPTSAPAGAIILHADDDVSAIVNAAPVGATFYFEPGVYRGVSITAKDGQTFLGAQGAVLNGSEVLTNWTHSGNLWVIGGQTQEGQRQATDQGEPGAMRAGYPETVFVDNTPLKPVDALSKVVPGTFYFDYAADKIYIADNPSGHTIEAGKLAYAFGGTAQNVTVQNFVVEKYDPAIQAGAINSGPGWTIQDNEVRLNYAVGITTGRWDWLGGDNTKIIDNYVHDNGQMGLGGLGNNILVQGNEIAKNGFWSGVNPGWEGGGFKFTDTDGLIVRSNYSHDNHGTGMWTDYNNIHTLYENNVVANNDGPGIQHEVSYDAVIRNNVVEGNGFGAISSSGGWPWGAEIQIQNSQNVDVYGNKIDNTGGGMGDIALIEQDRGTGPHGPFVTTGNHVHDNIIVDKGNIGITGGVADYSGAQIFNGTNTWDNNQFYMQDSTSRFTWSNSGQNFSGFEATTPGNGDTISQNYPDESHWVSDGLANNPTHSDPGSGTGAGDTGTGTGSGDTGTGTGDTGTGIGSGDTGTGTGATGTGSSTSTGTGDTGNGSGGTGTGATGTGSSTGTGSGDTGTGSSTSTGTGDTGNGTGSGGTGDTGNGTGSGGTGTGDTGTGTGSGGTGTGDTGTGTGSGGTGTGDTGTGTGSGGTGTGTGDTSPPPEHLVLRGGDGTDHLTGGDGNDQLYGARGSDILVGHAGNDVINGGSGRDILMGGAGNDSINGNSDKDYLLLDGTMHDYTFAVSRRGVTITNSAGEVDTVKNVEVFHFSDGTNYLIGRHGLVQTSDQTINKFLADSGVDQSYFSAVPTVGTQQQPVQAAASDAAATNAGVPQQASSIPSASADNLGTGTTPTSLGTSPNNHGPFGGFAGSDQLTTISGQALNPAGHPQGVDKALTTAALWNAVDAASNSPTQADTVLTDLKQQLHDAFDQNGANLTGDEFAALLHLTHHE